MARILITGSSEGLGLMAGQLLVEQGHQVVLHARNAQRADVARRGLPGTEAVVGVMSPTMLLRAPAVNISITSATAPRTPRPQTSLFKIAFCGDAKSCRVSAFQTDSRVSLRSAGGARRIAVGAFSAPIHYSR